MSNSPKWLLDSKGEFYNAIRYPEFAALHPRVSEARLA